MEDFDRDRRGGSKRRLDANRELGGRRLKCIRATEFLSMLSALLQGRADAHFTSSAR
jgi:hypothetical protein